MKDMKGRNQCFTNLSHQVIGCAIEVHRALGPGLLESTYKGCLARELASAGISFRLEAALPVNYKGEYLECGYRVDMLIGDDLILELKSVERLLPIHRAQILTYMKLASARHGLLINFNVPRLKEGLESFVL